MSELVTGYIDGHKVEVPAGTTILDAAKKLDIHIPTLCYHQDLPPTAACGVCVVEVEGSPTPKRACCTPLAPGMKITTQTKALRAMRRDLVEMILSDHEVVCPTCVSSGKCELQDLANNLGVDMGHYPAIYKDEPLDETSPSIVRDPKKCISCGRCITVCNEVQTVYAINFVDRGFDVNVNTFFKEGMGQSACVNCGQCTVVCPTGALREKSEIEQVWDAILDPEKIVVVQEAPAIRVSLAEEFGMEPGLATPGRMHAALKKMGFDHVFDTNFTADLTILEEGSELVKRVKEGGTLPLITSCSPGWVKFMETYFSDMAENTSTCKSPQQMFGALVKTYFAAEYKIDPAKIVSVSVMPCTAKKFEARRPEMCDSGYRDVDYVLTTREFIRMIHEAGIDFRNIEPMEAESLMGQYTGAGTIFGATGGVMEAAIRSAWFLLTGNNLEKLDVEAVRGMEGIKEAELVIPTKDLGDLPVKVAVTHGLGNARKLLEKVRAQIKETGKSEYAFIEIMACPGGCVGGGGQPYGSTLARRARRGEGLYKEDISLQYRQSHENPGVMGPDGIYAKFLDEPLGEKSHKLLHTCYWERCRRQGAAVRQVTHKHHDEH